MREDAVKLEQEIFALRGVKQELSDLQKQHVTALRQCETYERQYKEMKPMYDIQKVEAAALRKEMLALSATCDVLRSELMEAKTKPATTRETKKAKHIIRPSEVEWNDNGDLTEETEK